MNRLKDFQIDIFNLGLKLHEFEFAIDDRIFAVHEQGIIEKGQGKCLVELEKSATMMNLKFHIEVTVNLTCDRSLDEFDYPIKIDESLIIKFGEENYSLSEDVLVIRQDTPSINLAEYIYEFIMLAVPMKKLHPRYEATEEDEPELIYTSSEENTTEDETDEVDPRWEALKKLKGNK